MLVSAILGLAAAVCTLPATIDPNSACVEDDNGFSTIDADSDTAIPISLDISIKGETTDAFQVVHPATSGSLSDDTATDGRYILSCPQAAGLKTVQFSISRPADLTAFGAEWVQLFPKDSWSNTTNEYEPFTFNEFGAKIPLPEFRPTSSGLATDAAPEPVLHVFMEVSDEGDYEVKYGNPGLVSGSKWVAVEFKSTLLRVGAPWADCTGSTLDAPSYALGSIMPILFGGPNTNSIALKAGNPSYDDAIAELSGVSVPVKVVLEIFTEDTTTYTSSGTDGQCYKAGNSCPEAHAVCEPEYCEMDVWASIIAGFKAASPGQVTVLGSVDVVTTATSAYDALDVDGFYLLGTESIPAPSAVTLVADGFWCWTLAGTHHVEDANGVMISKTAAVDTPAKCGAAVLADPKCGAANGKSPEWFSVNVNNFACYCYAIDTCTTAPGYPYTASAPTQIYTQAVPATRRMSDGVTVAALGAPLFDDTLVDTYSIYVTLAGSELGIWNPFSWYPYVSPSKWAAIVTDAADTSAVATLVDRGYGWVYLTSETGFGTKSSMTPALLAEIEGVAASRRLQSRRLQASEPFWGCDDTLLECKPICMKQIGAVTAKVSDKLCAAAPMDQCACKCYHEAQWQCEGSAVVCKAKHGAGELKTVGDKVCEIRGAKKPASAAELRVAEECVPVTEMRGSAPTAECLEQWKTTPAPTAAAEQAAAAEASPMLLDESSAAVTALAALLVFSS